jgi:hypothetical protein
MKYEISNTLSNEARVGDLIISGTDEVRMIVQRNGDYWGLDLESGSWGYCAGSIEALVREYSRFFRDVRVVKSEDAKLVIK